MAGATLSSPILHSHPAFGSSKKIALDSIVAMDTGNVDNDVTAPTSNKNCSIISETVKTSPINSRTTFAASEVMKCSHCNYTSHSTSEMTQHRWEVHPLLTRRKQHLMKQSEKTRKRQNSESPEPSLSLDYVTPSKRTLILKDIPSERLQQPQDSCGHVKRSCSAGGVVKDANATTEEPPRQRKSFSLGDLSSLKQNYDVNKASQLSFVASSATAPPVADFVARKPFPSANSSVLPAVTSSIEATSSRSAAEAISSSAPDNASARGGLYTLARAALSAESAFVASLSSEAAGDSSSSVPTTHTSQRPVPSSLLYAPWATSCNVSYSSDGTDDKKSVRINPFSFVPYVSGGLVPHALTAILPVNAVNGGMYFNPAQMHVPAINPEILSPHLFSRLPLNLLSSVSDGTRSNVDVAMNATSSCNSKLTTLSDVATSLLNSQSELMRSKKEQRCISTALPKPKLQPSPTEKPLKISRKDGSHDVTTASASVKTSPATALASSNESSPAAADTQKTKRSPYSLSLPCFPKVATGGMELERASPIEQRSPLIAQAMDEDRVKSLEAALRNTDCCDPNERSNILPFRCSDGKWQMVRTKRIGGAWLVQAPGREGPSVYLPNKEKNNGETLNDWLKAKLNSFTGNSVHSKAENNKTLNKGSRTMQSTKPYPGFNKISAATINNAKNDAIRNLLLHKTAIA